MQEGRRMKTLTNRHGHLEGFCSLRFFPGAVHKIVTCGADSLVKVHDLDQVDDEGGGVTDIDHFQEPVHAVAVRRDGAVIAAGGEEREVSLFDASSFDFMKNVARFSLPIRDLSFSPNSSGLAIASDDPVIKVVDTDDPSKIKLFEGHIGGIKSVAFDPKGKYLASSGADSTVRIWDVESSAERKRFDKVFSRSSAAATADKGVPSNMCKVAWSNEGGLLAVAGNVEVKVYERDTWEEKDAFVGGSQHEVSHIAFSPNGMYLLSVDTAGMVVIWDVSTRESITRYENPSDSKILTANWDPLLNSIALIAADGGYGVVMDVITGDRLGPSEMLDDEEEEAGSTGDGEAEDELEDLTDSPKRKSKDDMGRTGRSTSGGRGGHSRTHDYDDGVELQPPFQPQSTRMEMKRRFMAYTFDGFITSRMESTTSFIEIEFADIERHRPIRFNDYTGYTMACMGSIGAAFASPESKEGGQTTPSTIYYRPFDSWAPQSDWTVSLALGEEVTCIAIGQTFVAVSTSKQFLRIFSFSGIQIHVYSLPAPCVCMSGQEDMLGIVYHLPSSPSPSGDQILEFQLMDIKNCRLLAKGPMCISAGSTIEWFAVLASGMLAVMDSEGISKVYSAAVMGGQWCPVLDIKERNKPRDWFWPIGIDDHYLTGVICKIEKRYPDVLQPVVSRFELQIPLCKADAGEEKWQRGQIFLAHDVSRLGEDSSEMAVRSLDLDKGLLQLINAACEQDKLMRALDLAMMIKSEKALQASVTLANRHRQRALAEKIDLYRLQRIAQEEAQEEEQEEYEEEEVVEERHHRSPPRREERAPKRARVDEENMHADQDTVEVDSDREDREAPVNDSLETPPGPSAAAPRRPASIFAIKNSGGQAAPKESIKFADKMKDIQQKQQLQDAAARSKPLMGPLGGLGAKGKGFGAGKGRKQKAGK